ncbi:MAG: transposase [Ignavibacteriaceae bacterium]
MNYNPKHHHRKTIRLKEYDYSQPNWYYVTICAHKKESLFGSIHNGKMQLNKFGEMTKQEWLKTKIIRPNIDLDDFVIMPNHLHGIIIIEYKINSCRGESQYAPTDKKLKSPSQSLGAIIRGFKSSVTKQINVSRNALGKPVWQRNYYKHKIRNETDLFRIRHYIKNNPLEWELELDELYS